MRSRWATIVPCGLATVLIAAYLRPAAADPRHLVPGPFGGVDAVLQAGLLEWTGRHFWQPAIWFQLPIFHPAPYALAFMDSLLGQALLVWPLRWLPGATPALLYDLALIGSLALAGLGFTLLWRAGGGGAPGAAWGSLVLLGAPYTLSQLGHLNQLPAPPAMMAMAAALAVLRRETPAHGGVGGAADGPQRGAARAWWLWAGALVLQAAWGWYGLAQAVCGSAVLLGWCLLRAARRGGLLRLTTRAAGPALAAAAGVLLLAWPYLQAARAYEGFERAPTEVRAFSADLPHLLRTGAYRAGWVDWTGRGEKTGAQPADGPRQVLHPGWIALAAGLAGWCLRRRLAGLRGREGRAWLLIGAVGLVLAFGDSVGLPGTDRRLPLPLGLLQEAVPPLRAFRAAWRFAFLASLAVAWWGAAAYETWAAGSGRRRWRAPLLILPACALLLESLPAGLPAVRVPVPEAGPAALPAGPVLTLPAPADEADEDLLEAGWLFRALGHGRPVTGGVSGWVPPRTRALRASLAASEAGRLRPDSLLAALADQGLAVVEVAQRDVLRWSFWDAALREAGHRPAPSAPGYSLYLARGTRPTSPRESGP